MSSSLYDRQISPFLQSGLVFITMIVFMAFGKLLSAIGIMEVKQNFPWLVSTSFMLFYGIFNAVLSIAYKNSNKYWSQSILSYAILAVLGGVMAYLFSSLTMTEAGPFRWLYISFTISYVVFIAIIIAMKKIVSIAIKQDKRLRGEE